MNIRRATIIKISWLLLAILVGFLGYQAVVPFGRVSYQTDFLMNNFFIQKLTPAERLTDSGTEPIKIVGDPVYFSLTTLRPFSQAKFNVVFKNDSSLPIVELGLLADSQLWRYQTQPLQNKIIDNLAESWTTIANSGLILLQRTKQFVSIDQFLADLPPTDQIAVYNYDLKNNFRLADYQPASQGLTIKYPLRGGYQFYTYIKNEDLVFNFYFKDLNQNRDADPIKVKLYKDSKMIGQWQLADDGNSTDNNLVSAVQELKVKQASLTEGVYKLEVAVNDDIVTDQISSLQSKLAFINKLWLADGPTNQLALFTDSAEINVETSNPAKLQTILIDDSKLELSATYQQYNLRSSTDLSEIKLTKNDLILAGNGVFSFSKAAFISPDFKKVDAAFNGHNISYIIAKYSPPVVLADGWLAADSNFDLSSAYREKLKLQLGSTGKYSFLLSIPGLRAEASTSQGVIIKQLKVDLIGTSLFEKLLKKFKQIF